MKKVFFILFVAIIFVSCGSHSHIDKDISFLSKRSAELENKVNELELNIKSTQEMLYVLSDITKVANEEINGINNRLIDTEMVLSIAIKHVDSFREGSTLNL